MKKTVRVQGFKLDKLLTYFPTIEVAVSGASLISAESCRGCAHTHRYTHMRTKITCVVIYVYIRIIYTFI